jgi:MerR family transcriptional regulator, light-induced transcriptional regulator
MNAFTIKDLETLSGIKAHTIRIWEQRYSLLKPNRTDTNIRYYDSSELKNLLNIAILNKYGYKISHITHMTPMQIKEKILMLNDTDAQLERIITELINYMIDFDTENFEHVIDGYIAKKGIERTITQVIFPFLSRVGILWQTDSIIPAQEHIVTSIIRQKLIISTESVLIFMPEGEYHELGLLYVQYLLKSRGVKTIYLGSNVPVKDLPVLISIKKPDYLYTHITSLHQSTGFEKFLLACNKYLQTSTIKISGLLAQNYNKPVSQNIELIKSMSESINFINSL